MCQTNKDLKFIESELNALRGVVGDINVMVGQQGENIDQAEVKVEVAASNIEAGTQRMCDAYVIAISWPIHQISKRQTDCRHQHEKSTS